MKRDVSVEPLEEPNPIANQNRQNRITNFIGQPETEALAANNAASDEPDVTERGPQTPVHKLRKIA
jgi:hypothetical protein